MKLAFIGLGIMGKPMAGHLLAAGHSLAVYSRTKSKADELVGVGATWADSPAAAARDAEVVLLCVTDTPDVAAVLFGPNGVAESIERGAVVVDHSTISPEDTREFAAVLRQQGVGYVDAPVSGGDKGAREATLSVMCGGSEADFARVKPLLETVGKTVVRVGEVGSGQATKLVNQILVAGTLAAVADAMRFVKASGLDGDAVLRAVGGGAAKSWQLDNLGPKMLAGDFAPGFMIDLMTKDLRLVVEAAANANVSLPSSTQTLERFTRAIGRGDGRRGTQALFREPPESPEGKTAG